MRQDKRSYSALASNSKLLTPAHKPQQVLMMSCRPGCFRRCWNLGI